ncbi:MAG: DUF499 domain-containing protein [Atopobiaceae bacterium]|nr:DUF499 domain-containing protein [Atopobiaceae bacterium]
MGISTSNNMLIGNAFDLMREQLGMYEMREFIRCYKDGWWRDGVHGHLYEDQLRDVLPATATDDMACVDSLDVLLMLRLIKQSWNDVFRAVMDRRTNNWVGNVIDARNDWAHATGDGISDEDAVDYLRAMVRIMDQIDPETASAINDYKQEIESRHQVTVAAESRPAPVADTSLVRESPLSNPTATALRAWRTVVAPKDDVARGQFKTAEFALDLATIAKGDARDEYQRPKEFFSRTYITEGMKSLLITALKRVSLEDDDDGDPVVELKTAFGGGKTHSMLAVYHLMRNAKIARELPGIAEVMDEARVPALPEKVYVATLVGTDLEPANFKNPAFLKGKVNTLWGEMAYQLCLQKGDPEPYSIIRPSDSKSIAPGTDALVRFFNAIGPCVILMDEFVVYARNLYGNDNKNLPAGTFANVLSFVQQLTEAVKRTDNCMLIASLPASERELGDEGGVEALRRVERVFGRINTIWRAATNEEGFEIVKRRLFKDYDTRLAEPVVDAFMKYYRSDPDKFPLECREADYRHRILRCYPIHPQVFDRLYNDWSTLDNFQRTRGVLRLMATVIHKLWDANDADPLIMPGSIDYSDGRIKEEVFQYLDPAWNAVVDGDVDGEGSMPAQIDNTPGRFSRSRAARRVARTVFLGSAPTARGANLRGLDVSDIRLGAAVPGTDVTVYDDALNKMRDELSYLYTTGTRYWFDTHPTLEKTARKYAAEFDAGAVDSEVVHVIQLAERQTSSGFASVYVCPASTLEVPDSRDLALVIIPPSRLQGRDAEGSPAVAFATDILTYRGESLRTNRNMLLFAAASGNELREARDAVRRSLAWQRIDAEADGLDLTKTARAEAKSKLGASQDRAKRLVMQAYRWLLAPSQDVGDLRSIEWDPKPITGSDGISKRAFDRAARDELVLTDYSPFLLSHDLDSMLWNGRDHMSASELVDDYCRYLYLRRLADSGVLRSCLERGVESGDYFAYADGWDEEKGRYAGLRMGPEMGRPHVDLSSGLVVQVTIALRELAFGRGDDDGDGGGQGGDNGGHDDGDGDSGGDGDNGGGVTPPVELVHEVRLEASLDKLAAGMEVGDIVAEILQQLYDLGGVSAELTFSAIVDVADGVDEKTMRVVRENANTLGVTLRTK